MGPAAVRQMLQFKFPDCKAALQVSNLNTGDAKHAKHEAEAERLPCLFSVGSVMHMTRAGDHIWGTGINPYYFGEFDTTPGRHYYSVRGPKSAQLLNLTDISYGDPGYLLAFWYPNDIGQWTERPTNCSSSWTHAFCYVPHYHDLESKETKIMRTRNVTVLSPRMPLAAMLEQLCTCQRVASSSLHGLIVGDAMGKPILWFQSKNTRTRKTEGSFKYQDYLASVNRSSEMKLATPITTTQGVLDPDNYMEAMPYLDRLAFAQAFASSFPYNLFVRE
eukprot:m.3517 g.3517  ORF g.3517 m.3517 type:complete len:276 (-) comp5751_c0_seq1:361-1188(-)